MQTKLRDLNRDESLVQAAGENLSSSSAVSKPVRAGCTTSTIYACEDQGIPLLAIAPTRRILNDTVAKASSRNAVRVPGNTECFVLKEEIRENPILSKLPLPLPECDECHYSKSCKVLEILRAKEFSTASLTYAKLEALMLSKSKTAQKILRKLSKAKVVLLDEAHLIGLPSNVSVSVFTIPDEPPNGYPMLSEIRRQWLELCQRYNDSTQELMLKATKGYSQQHLAKSLTNLGCLGWKSMKRAWSELKEAAISHAMPNNVLLTYRDIISVLGSEYLSLGFVGQADQQGSVSISASQKTSYKALQGFLKTYARHAKHIYVSGTLIEPKEGFFSELSGQPVRQVIFPDLRGATSKMTLIPDRWRLTSRNFSSKLPLIIETIRAIADQELEPIYLLAPNSRKAKIIKQELEKAGIGGIFVDYYRSDWSMGVERSERVCIAIGLAEVPANACDTLARGDNPEERWINSRALRLQAVHCATWQAVNRVRDPEGKVESRVYFVGCKLDQVRRTAIWGTNRRAVLREIKEKRGIRTPIFDIKTDQELELPRIYGEDKNKTRSEKRSVKDLVGSVELYNINRMNSQNHYFLSIYNRHLVAKLGIYNIPSDKTELALTTQTLLFLLGHRQDCFARQVLDYDNQIWGYEKILAPLAEEVIMKHITGEITIGAYQIGLDDTVTWCADDIDSHHGETDAKEKVGRIVEVLRKYGIPFLLESSGSPDSYHIWIPLAETKTYNAYRFIRQINAEAKVDCECWPKQKSLSKKGKYGNLIKLPICLHRKTGNRSVFLDPDNFEPLKGLIPIPSRVRLLEIPELTSTEPQGMPRVSVRKQGLRRDTSLDYCMQKALDERVALEGSEGHHLRLAISVKSRAIGMTPEEAARLFQYQKDYDYEYSRKKAEEAETYDYAPWSCQKLRDKCGKLVSIYCPDCPFGAKGRSVDAKENRDDQEMATQKVLTFYLGLRDDILSGKMTERFGHPCTFEEGDYQPGDVVQIIFLPGEIPGPIVKILDIYMTEKGLFGGAMSFEIVDQQVALGDDIEAKVKFWKSIVRILLSSGPVGDWGEKTGLWLDDVAEETGLPRLEIAKALTLDGWKPETTPGGMIFWAPDKTLGALVLGE